jgi:hypothetical protein
MHKKNTQRLSKLMSTAGILTVLFGGLVAQSVRAVSSNPTPVCVGATCTVTFESNGDYYLWAPPSGAKNISFDLMGAQGGRSGGLGGRVTGTLINTPTSLYIFVGGEGKQGSGVAGGFNGGGNAGSGRGDEGSGGGATDIRSTTSTNDRIAVAGGGGGSGGYGGGIGGSAGGLNASAGTSGQGQGGSGATQSSGGNGGYPNGGSWGSTGDFGVGGAGGSSYVSGGGGGGGGFYGGGGGGADIDTCCSNAGGGGGGSSWSHSVQTSNVSHTGGYRAGAGIAVLSYSLPPAITTFAANTSLTNASNIDYSLVFNETVTGLTSTDFSTTGSSATCGAITISGSQTTYAVSVTNCGVGTLKLNLNAFSVNGALSGPASIQSASDVVIERIAPTAVVTSPSSPNAAAALAHQIDFSEPITGLSSADFSVLGLGCSIGTIAGIGTSYTVQVINCTDGVSTQLSLLANSVTDLAGNSGPTEVQTAGLILIDRTAPVGAWAAPVTTSVTSPAFEINFMESITGLAANDFIMIGAATNCLISVQEVIAGLKFKVETSGCEDGTVQMMLNANSYTDSLGNLGPTVVLASAVTTKGAPPAPAPPTPAPPAPAPAETAPLSQPVPSLEPKVDVIPAETEIVAAQPIYKTYALTPIVETEQEPVSEEALSYPVSDSQITVQNPTAAKPISSNQNNWMSLATIAIGAVSISLAAIGVFKGLRQMRSRRLVRKFS